MNESEYMKEARRLADDLRQQCATLRQKPVPLAHLIPLMQRAADALSHIAKGEQARAVGGEVTDAMVDAYLQANDAYWKRTDELPTPPNKWRTGTPREATRESLRAALAAAPLAVEGDGEG